jgi:hypothetical protein
MAQKVSCIKINIPCYKHKEIRKLHMPAATVITLLLVEINQYYQQHSEFLDDGSSVPDVNGYRMFLLLAIIIKMGHNTQQPERLLAACWTVLFTILWQDNET